MRIAVRSPFALAKRPIDGERATERREGDRKE